MIASVIWYNSHPHLLDRLLCSLVGRVDGVVLLDGPYKGLSDVEDSPRDNYETFERYRDLLDMRIPPAEIYPSEAAKHEKAARVAKAEWPEADRLLGIDNDEALISDIPSGCPLTAALYQEGTLTARMVRVVPLTTTITWGPRHSDIKDGGTVYWTPDLVSSTTEHQFKILHTPGDKRIQKEYDAYNAAVRPGIEE